MDLISYLRALIAERTFEAKHDPTKLVPKDKANIAKDKTVAPKKETPTETKYKVDEKGLNKFFPKEMNWLNWEDKGFRDALLDSQVWTESRGNPNAVGPMTSYGVKAVGLTQFMPGTWESMKKRGWIDKDAKRTDPKASIKAQKEYMTWLYDRPDVKASITPEDRYARTLASYNAGYGTLKKAVNKAGTKGGYWLDYMPKESQNYVGQIMDKTEEEYFKDKENYISKYNRD